MFKTKEGGTISKEFKSRVPKQMPNTAASRNFDKGTESAGYALNWSMIICAIINVVYAGVLQKIVGSVMHIQVIIFEALMMFLLPGNSINYVNKIKPIITFNILKFLTDLSTILLPVDTD